MTKVHIPRRMRPLSAAAKSRLPQGAHSDRPLSDRSVVDLSQLVPQLGSLFVRRTSEVGSQPVRHDRQRPRLQLCPLEARARTAYRSLRFRCRDARRWSRLAIRTFARIRTVSGKGKPCPLGIRGRTSAPSRQGGRILPASRLAALTGCRQSGEALLKQLRHIGSGALPFPRHDCWKGSALFEREFLFEPAPDASTDERRVRSMSRDHRRFRANLPILLVSLW